jgi:signal transduction histidine kinase
MPFSGRRSLAVKIPLLLSALLLLALATMSVASYLELRSALVELATTRLQQAADQMANVFAMTVRQRVPAMRQLMNRSDVRDYLRTRDAKLQPSIDAAVRSYLGVAAAVANVELWDPAGQRLFASGAAFDAVDAASIDDYKKDLRLTNDASIGRLQLVADGLLHYPVGGAIAQDGQTLGYVVERRRFLNPAQTRQLVQLLTGLIGNEATIILGNADGSIWSDLESSTRQLRITANEGRLWDYRRAGRPRTLAWATPINATPWAVAIEFPRDVVLEPSRRFIARSLLIALVLLIASVTLGWFITRRITTPLVQVTEAAEAVTDLRPHVHVDIDREDEIGRLADSFNIMAARVEQSRHNLEQRVEQRTEELLAANRELEAFSYSVSHDLRAPLRAIAGFVQILDEDHGPALAPDARRHLERVKVNAQRMGQLIDDLLNFSRIGRTLITRQQVDMNALAATVAQDTIAASGRNVEINIDTLPPAYGEPSLLNQVFINLISNAVKFTARAERPSIKIGSVTQNGEIVYCVQDNGVGFDERYAEKLFGVFQRLHRLDDFEGTGVGLAIVHRIITRHGGRVWAQGKPNAGATFYFTIPAPASAEATAGKPPAA